MTHVLALSGGKDSTALALAMKEREPDVSMTYVYTPTGDELPDMVEHWQNLECLLGSSVVNVSDGFTLRELVRDSHMLPNFRARYCTRIIKIQRFEYWLNANLPAVVYIGLRADEEDREGGRFDCIDGCSVRFPLREWGWGITEVRGYLANRGVQIPRRTDCARCFYQTLSEWWTLWRDHPDIWADAVEDERVVSEARDKRHTYRSAQRDTWPAALADLGAEFASGKVPKNRHGIPANQLDLGMDVDRSAMCSWCAR